MWLGVVRLWRKEKATVFNLWYDAQVQSDRKKQSYGLSALIGAPTSTRTSIIWTEAEGCDIVNDFLGFVQGGGGKRLGFGRETRVKAHRAEKDKKVMTKMLDFCYGRTRKTDELAKDLWMWMEGKWRRLELNH